MPEPSILQVVLMGLITVFIGLICLIIIIKIMGAIVSSITGNKAPAAAPVPAPAAPAPAPAQAPRTGNQQLVAAISAAIAEEMGEDVDHINILSIRRL